MTAESILGIAASVISIGGFCVLVYRFFKKRNLKELMDELANKNTTLKRQHRILHRMNRTLLLSGHSLSSDYIKNFHSNGRSKLNIFYEICNENDIEPTPELCKQLLGYDERKFRSEWVAKHIHQDQLPQETSISQNITETAMSQSSSQQTVFLSALLPKKYPDTCKRLTNILQKHNVSFAFIEGTKDIWCRDYMPVQTPSGKLIQFRYEPSYLDFPEYQESRSDVHHVCDVNGLTPIFSDINLDGGNVVMFKNKAIVTDRVYSENPNMSREDIRKELARLLECELIIIPAYGKTIDFTGHADGMVRFVDENTVIGNELSKDTESMKKAMERAMRLANLRYIEFPYFDYEIKGNDDHAIGVYLNYLEVGDLIVMPVFGYPGNKDTEALTKLKEVFPDKVIETIDYNDVALTGGILNCTTWVVKL